MFDGPQVANNYRGQIAVYLSVSLSFFAIFFCNFWQILGFLSVIYCIFAIWSVFLGIFFGNQERVLPVAPISE